MAPKGGRIARAIAQNNNKEEPLPIETIKISNDAEAFGALKAALANEVGPETQVIFENWPVFKLTISGESFEGSIPTRIMPPILDLQKEIYRIYSRVRYNTEDIRSLKQEERDLLELVVEINPGSTEFIAEAAQILNEIIRSTGMSSQEALILLVSIAGMATGLLAWKEWLRAKERAHGQESTVELSKEETKRLELVTQAMSRQPLIAESRASMDQFKDKLTRRLKPEDRLSVSEQPIINGDRAAQIVPAVRSASQEVRVDGEFVINEVKFPQSFGEKYRFVATRLADGKHFAIDAHPETLSAAQISILKEGGFSVKRVVMQIDARLLRDNITDANLVSITWPAEAGPGAESSAPIE